LAIIKLLNEIIQQKIKYIKILVPFIFPSATISDGMHICIVFAFSPQTSKAR